MNYKTTFFQSYSKTIQLPSIPLNTRRVGVNLTCPYCKRTGKKFVIIYPMLDGKIITFKGRKRCHSIGCNECGNTFIVSVNCLEGDCGNRVTCLQKGIIIVDVSHLYEPL